MAVLALIYHCTPKEAGHPLDVAMPQFRAQVQILRAAGVQFIRFGEALDRCWYGGDTVVSITFDDGHESNLEAMEFLHNAGIPSTSFFVSDYVRNGQNGFMGPAKLKAASALCEVGAHGASHMALTTLGSEALEAELSASKAYLEAICGGPVTALSAPGGKINGKVIRAALKLGFKIVGDSKGLLNTAPSLPLHRVSMLNDQSPEHVLSLVRAGRLHWLSKRLRRMAVAMAARSLGDQRLETLKSAFNIDQSRISL
jgi:peptidoglycan/xylan/chitin deacetylase (PgdA/CDA1 family)